MCPCVPCVKGALCQVPLFCVQKGHAHSCPQLQMRLGGGERLAPRLPCVLAASQSLCTARVYLPHLLPSPGLPPCAPQDFFIALRVITGDGSGEVTSEAFNQVGSRQRALPEVCCLSQTKGYAQMQVWTTCRDLCIASLHARWDVILRPHLACDPQVMAVFAMWTKGLEKAAAGPAGNPARPQVSQRGA